MSSLFQTTWLLQLPQLVELFSSVEEQKDVKSIDIPISIIALHC